MDIRNVQNIVTATLTEGGVTLDIITFDQPQRGYAVASGGSERKVSTAHFNVKDVLRYIGDHHYELTNVGAHLGTWVDGGLVYLDVTTVIDTLAEALPTATARGELAIYDLANQRTIRTAVVK